MLRSTCADSGAQEIGFIYTSLLSVLLLASVITSVSGVLQGNLENTAQEEVEQVGSRLQLAIQDLLLAADELVADDVVRAALGTGRDGDYVDYFAQTKRDEFHTITDQVTSAELDTYLSLF